MKFFSKKMLQKWSLSREIVHEQLTKEPKGRMLFRASDPATPSGDSANFIQIGLASSEEIQNWAERSCFIGSHCYEIGEVKRPDTLNYRTFKPEKDGLFCERIFGPVNDWTCSCGQLKEQRFAIDHERVLLGKFKPKICNVCQVEVTSSRLRRYRMGYISLACPVTHIWYLNSRPSLFSILLKMPTKYVKKIAYYKAYSPSSLSIEYMSACLGPGGDFFDNEWEFLHFWLSGKHSLEDKPSPITKNLQKRHKRDKRVAGWDDWGNQTDGAKRGGVKLAPVTASDQVARETMQRSDPDTLLVGRLDEKIFALEALEPKRKSKKWSWAEGPIPALLEPDCRKMPESPEWLSNTGAQALSNHLQSRDWEKEIEKLEFELQSTPTMVDNGQVNSQDELFSEKESDFLLKRRKNRVRTLKLLKSFQKSGFSFTGMIFTNLPVLPPELRPIIQLGAGQLASSDVNDLYRRILSRNNRLKYYLYETHFVEFLVRSEQQLVQLAVDALLENGKTTTVRHTSGQKRLYKSLSDRIGGKQGRFRMNLLGKRVDYSGRSVIVVGPKLKLSQCGLPYEMALELFQPFLLRHMLELQLAKTIRAAKNILRFNKPLARQLLHHVVQAHPILLNRAPTLHRLGIQAFQPVLVYGRAIHLHPLVCPAFNADFDGDQMAVHIPLSPQARIEARFLMLASGNWLSSSTGQPNVLPSQDMVLGFYYLTLEKYGYQKGRGLVFQNLNDVLQSYQLGSLDLHSQIWVKWSGPFTSDLNSKTTPPFKHLNASSGEAEGAGQGGPSAHQSVNEEKDLKHLCEANLISRFRREQDQPIEIRLNQNGICTKIYSSYQWQEDSQQKQLNCYIRTTPGRVLMNQLFHKFV